LKTAIQSFTYSRFFYKHLKN